MLFHEGGTSSSSANMIVKPVPSMYSEIYHEKEFSFWLKETSVPDKTVIVNLHCNNDDFTENHRKDDDVSLWLLNTKFSLPSKPMPTFEPSPYCWPTIYGQQDPAAWLSEISIPVGTLEWPLIFNMEENALWLQSAKRSAPPKPPRTFAGKIFLPIYQFESKIAIAR